MDDQTRTQTDRSGSASRTGTALITAGASGVGKTMAQAFRAAGWDVHVCDVDPRAIEGVTAAQDGITASLADVASPADAERTISDALAHHGRIDVLINNAGIAGATGPVDQADPDDFRRVLDVNVTGAFLFTRAVAPVMRAAGHGAIINIASTAALFGYPLRSAYAASKWALIGLTKTWAMELGPAGVRVNAICPGSVEGERIDGVIARDAASRGVDPALVRRTYERQTSLRTFVSGEDIANMALFLASESGRRISGQTIAVDGHTETLAFDSD